MASKTEPSEGVIVPRTRPLPYHILNPKPLPPELEGTFSIKAWLASVIKGAPYEELDPEFLSHRMALQTLMSETYDELLSDTELPGLQKILPNTPGATTGLIDVTWLYVAKSGVAEGLPCYMLFTMFSAERGEEVTTHTSATQLQIQFAGALAMGVWPIHGAIKRTERLDRGGRFLMKLYLD